MSCETATLTRQLTGDDAKLTSKDIAVIDLLAERIAERGAATSPALVNAKTAREILAGISYRIWRDYVRGELDVVRIGPLRLYRIAELHEYTSRHSERGER